MRPWGRSTESVYRGRELQAHDLLHDVPLHDVWHVFLPEAGRPFTMPEVRSVARSSRERGAPGIVLTALFGLRRLLGSAFRWDVDEPAGWTSRVSARVPPEVAERSLVRAGTQDGPFSVVYVLESEAMSEIRNATVEAYLVWSLERVEGGAQLLWGIHVTPLGLWGRPYMALIAPFRRFLVYPRLLNRLHDDWVGRG